MIPKVPLSEVQTLWLRELGVSMLWGQALRPYQAENVGVKDAVETKAVEPQNLRQDRQEQPLHAISESAVPSDGQGQAEVTLIKRSSPEGKTKAGRVSREQAQAIQEIHQNFQKQRTRQSRRSVSSVPIVQAQDWVSLEAEIRHQYLQWGWASDEKEVLLGQEGKTSPDLMIIEEMPGADDYVEGSVFSGDSGVLLANILSSIGLVKEDVAITSLFKVHRRDETSPEQYLQCLPYLQAQIQLLEPKCIWLLGARAAQPFLKQDNSSMEMLRGQEWFYPLSEERQIPVVVSHHPSLLLINGALKADIWEDLHKINVYLQTSD